MATEESSTEHYQRQAGGESYLTRDFLLISLSGLCFLMSINMVSPAIPLYVVHMGGTQGQVGVMMAFRTIAALVARPLAGTLIDKGRVGTLLAFPGVSSAIVGVSYVVLPALWLVGAIEALRGLGVTAFTSAGSTAVANLAPPRRRGEALGIYQIISPASVAFAPAFGMFLLARTGFTSLFALSAVVGLISLVLAIKIRTPKGETSTSSSLGLISRQALLPAGALMCIAFALAPHWVFIPLYATQSGLGDLGPFYTINAASMFFIRLVSGRLSDIHGRVVVFVPGALAMALSSFYLSIDPGYSGLLLAGALLGIGEGAAQSALLALAIDRAPTAERGAAVSTLWAGFDVGVTLGTLADGFILEWGGFSAMFAANGIVPVTGVIGFLLLNRRRRRTLASG